MRTPAVAATALVLGMPLFTAPPAGAQTTAAGAFTVTSPRCGTIAATARAAGTGYWLSLDNQPGVLRTLAGTTTRTWGSLPAGRYAWQVQHARGTYQTGGWVTVAPCSSTWPRRLPQGDETGDGRADVMAVTRAGELYFYPSTNTGLGRGTKVGHGWNNIVMMQRLKQVGGPGQPNQLVVLRIDGTLWSYPTAGNGRVGVGRRIATGISGLQQYYVMPANNQLTWQRYVLWGRDAYGQYRLGEVTATGFRASDAGGVQTVYATARVAPMTAVHPDGTAGQLVVDRNGLVHDCRMRHEDAALPEDYLICWGDAVGREWQSMRLVISPGSVDGDLYSDLVARRSDGDLYLYRVVDGVIQPGAVIGHNWNGIKLLA